MPAWSMRRKGDHAWVVWQESQALTVDGWRGDLPNALVPLWQLEHSDVKREWSIRAGFHALVVWQSLHVSDDWICFTGFLVARMPLIPRRLPWQPEHVVGVPLKTAPAWHVSHATLTCPPVRGNPVVPWSKFASTRVASSVGDAAFVIKPPGGSVSLGCSILAVGAAGVDGATGDGCWAALGDFAHGAVLSCFAGVFEGVTFVAQPSAVCAVARPSAQSSGNAIAHIDANRTRIMVA